MITVFADRHLFKINEIVPTEIDLNLYDPEKGLPGDLHKADALLIRTVTPINKKTLSPVPEKLKFIGTGSAGTDHVDESFLHEHGITFSYAAGCNAQSVAEYVVTALLLWSEQRAVDLNREKIGIIGVGHVGSALHNLLEKLNWSYVLYDPPRMARDPSFESADLAELLSCSILTFHTPLTRKGDHPTFHWLDRDKLVSKSYKLVINTSRGGVINETDLKQSMKDGNVQDIIIDVWKNEPLFNDKLAEKAFIATPHIAGYSIQSKFRASKLIVDDMTNFFSLKTETCSLAHNYEQVRFPPQNHHTLTLSSILKRIHPISKYDGELRKLIGVARAEKKKRFRELRTLIPYRNEFAYLKMPVSIFEKKSLLKELIQA